MSNLGKVELLKRLGHYSLSTYCFSAYVEWITSNVPDGWDSYDLLRILNEGDVERLSLIENRLNESRSLLGMTEQEFVKAFGFADDLLSEDPEKIHDILAEPLLIPDLSRLGFSSLCKLPPFLRTDAGNARNADFLASRGDVRFAIELKTVRMENNPKPEPYRPLGNSTKPYWWGQMFRSNAITKIEDKKRRVLEQLANAKRHYQTDKTMLILYTRRLGPSTLMTTDDYISELQELQGLYPDLDHIGCKDYFGHITLFPEP